MSKSTWKVIRRVVGLFLLGIFLQWAGMTNPASQSGTVYAQIAQLVGGGSSPDGAVAKLPPQQ
jgi:hypothetical protein